MKSLKESHTKWLSGFEDSDLFRCRPGKNSCGVYHVLSPVLYDIGLLSSYHSYSSALSKITAGLFSVNPEPEILVMGTDGENSASELTRFFKKDGSQYKLTFIDRCMTPLLRIDACLEQAEQNIIRTELIDICTPAASTLSGKYDMVLADSFLNQFPEPERIRVLNKAAGFLKGKDSFVILREFFGDMDKLLPLFWNKMNTLLEDTKFTSGFTDSAIKKIAELAEELDGYYRRSGGLYSDPEKFISATEDSLLKITGEYTRSGNPGRIYVLKTR